ncbi:hypothetical protein [Oricola indica]|uniref:hypothetical protein n=1 Tax=Oricola indica TaxID=2872591 RepID=UPI003CCBD764
MKKKFFIKARFKRYLNRFKKANENWSIPGTGIKVPVLPSGGISPSRSGIDYEDKLGNYALELANAK